MAKTLKVVLDTCVLVAGLRSSRGASHQVLRAFADGQIHAVVSQTLYAEYCEVLLRESTGMGFSTDDMVAFLEDFLRLAKRVEIYYSWRPMLADEDDNMVLEAATNGGARYIVTLNQRDFSKASELGMRVISPGALLTLLDADNV